MLYKRIEPRLILTTEKEKVEKYQDLLVALGIKGIHRATRVKVIPVVIGALGTISGNTKGVEIV